MAGRVRGVFTLVGVAASGFLIWLSTQFDATETGGYWATIGLVAAAGLALVLAQLLGGWTKWGWPRVSGNVFVLGFLPALGICAWVIVSGQPDDNWFQRHVVAWSGDLHVARLVRHLREGYVGVLAFGLGALFGMTFDTTGPRRPRAARTAPATGEQPEVAREPGEDETRVLHPRRDENVAPPSQP